jgi:hypothetical protein
MKLIQVIFVFMSILVFSSCTKKREVTQECKQLSSDIEKLNHDHFINCVTTCFRTAYVQIPQDLQEKKKEQVKASCTNACRDNIDYAVINHIKSMIDEKYDCGFDFSKPLSNQHGTK